MAGDVLFIVSSLGLNVSLFQIGRVSILATGSTENGEQCPKDPARARATNVGESAAPTAACSSCSVGFITRLMRGSHARADTATKKYYVSARACDLRLSRYQGLEE